MDIADLIIEKLNRQISDEKEKHLKEWLKESYLHESMMMRLRKMKENGIDFQEVEKLDAHAVWKRLEKKEN